MENMRGVITCPYCGGKQEVDIPTNACLPFLKCSECGAMIAAKEGQCCVFCSYGDRKCPVGK